MAEATADELRQLADLKAAVYPDPPESYPETAREWTRPAWGVFVRVDGLLVSHTGVVVRDILVDGARVPGGGIGGVVTHPDHRGKGYAPLGMGRALDFLVGQSVTFALLACRDELVAYYEALGWKSFRGTTLNTQYGVPEVFEHNNVMVGDVAGTAPSNGTIDLLGPAW